MVRILDRYSHEITRLKIAQRIFKQSIPTVDKMSRGRARRRKSQPHRQLFSHGVEAPVVASGLVLNGKVITSTLKHCNLIINKKRIRHLIQKKPLPPSLNAQIKINIPNNPIRPVVNYKNATAYKIAKFLVNKLHGLLNLKYQYNVQDSISLASNLTKQKIDENHSMITFDITDLYVNIPITETLAITKHLLSEHNNEHITTQMLILLEAVLRQKQFSFQNNTY